MTLMMALASGCTVEDAARQAHMSVATAHRRLGEPAFRAAIQDARREVWTAALGRLVAATTAAVDTLRDLLDSPMDQCRIAAARSILEHAAKGLELADVDARLSALEDQRAPPPQKGQVYELSHR
jgi:hypothetical protein